MSSLNIVFAGTPEFGLPCLEAIKASQHTIKAVYTQPDRPAGRGRTLQASAVKEWAKAHEIPIYQPLNFKDTEAIAQLTALAPDILVVIAYGLILPSAVLTLPRLGCINVHASFLPRWRGASPIQQAILHGDTQSGVTIMQMDKGMDTGNILMQAQCPIDAHDTAQHLHDRLAELAITPLLTTLSALASHSLNSEKQNDLLATHAPKINKSDAMINWHQPAIHIDRQIRAFNPWPIAYTHINEQVLRVHQAQVLGQDPTYAHNVLQKEPGTILSIDKTGILVATADGCLLIERLQFSGSKVLLVRDWLNANRSELQVGLILQ
jgi:methionyl-tRNA formyltransferase